jgi:PAS domain S-box-containing protein
VSEPPEPRPADAQRNAGARNGLQRAELASARRADELGVLYRFTDRLFRADSEASAYAAALDAIIAGHRCERASILLFDEAGVMQFVASRGLSEAYRQAVTGHTPWNPGEPQPEPIHIDDVRVADLSSELKATVTAEGIGALAFIPLLSDGGVIGKFMAYYDKPHAFSREELELGLTIARQLGFAIERGRARAYRQRAEGELRQSKERLDLFFERSGIGMVLMRGDCVIVRANKVFADITGRTFEELIGESCLGFTHPDDLDANKDAAAAMAAGGGPTAFEKRYIRPDDSDVWVRVTLSKVADDQILAVVEDISERRASEERRRKRDAEFRALADNMAQLAWMTDASGAAYWFNKRFFDYTGLIEQDLHGPRRQTLTHPDHAARVQASFRRAVEAGQPWEDTFPLLGRDGEYRWFLSRALPIHDEQGRVARWFGTNTDITERLQAEEQRTLLINELNHRVKNTLATVQSLAMQTLREDVQNKEALALFNSRLAALSRAHDILTHESWKGAQLRQIVDQSVAPFRTTDRIDVGGPDARVTPKQALALSIALHELGTNAMKYGALSDQGGRITLAWSVDHGALHMSWRESGGPPVTPPTRSGFGTRLIERSLSNDLGGEARILYLPAGVVAQMSTPLEVRE